MVNSSQLSSLDKQSSVIIEIVPIDEEAQDFDTLAILTQVHTEMLDEAAHLEGFTVSSLPKKERGLDIIVLITLIGAAIATYKDLLTSFFNMVTAALELLAKKEHVQEVEIIADGKTLILRDLSRKSVTKLIETLKAQYPDTTTTHTPAPVVKLKAKTSKKRRALKK